MAHKTLNIIGKRLAAGITAVATLLIYVSLADAQVMTSPTYRIQTDSVNVGGGNASSAGYGIEDTAGEAATGFSDGVAYRLHAGYQQNTESFISMTAASDAVMTPAISGVIGGSASGSTYIIVTTSNLAGYELSMKAESEPALQIPTDSFGNYAPAGSDPDFSFAAVAANDARFGFTPEGADIVQAYRDNGSVCNAGSLDTADACWTAVSTSTMLVSKSTSGNYPEGATTTLKFRAEAGSSRNLSGGTYVATTTVTVIAL